MVLEKQFKFKNIEGMIDWYFSTVYEVIKEKYNNPFHKHMILRVVRGIHQGILYNIKNF